MRVHLGGHLAFYDVSKRSDVSIDLDNPLTLQELLQRLGVPIAEIAIAAINGAAVEIDNAIVSDDDRLNLYPPVGGGLL